MKTKSTQQGFTLIELVIVIVILGILAAVALPRFMNFTSGAREGVLAGISGAISSVNTMVYAQAAIQGVQNAPTAMVRIPGVDINGNGLLDDGDTVPVAYGYLRSNAAGSTALQALLQVSGDAGLNNNNQISFQVQGGQIRIGYPNANGNVVQNECYISYQQATGLGSLPQLTSTDASTRQC